MEGIPAPEGLTKLADQVDIMLTRSSQQQRQHAEFGAGVDRYLLAKDASLQSPAQGVDDRYQQLCEEAGANPQADFISSAFDALDKNERAQLMSAMTLTRGALAWLNLHGLWILARLRGSWQAATTQGKQRRAADAAPCATTWGQAG